MSSRRVDRATPSLIEPAVLREALVATVAPLAPIDKTYSYLVPEELAGRVRAGVRVRVPFGRSGKPQVGFCVEVSRQEWASTLKTIVDVVDDAPVIDAKLLELGRWISRYYCAYLGHTLDMMVPAAAKAGAGRRRVRYVSRVMRREQGIGNREQGGERQNVKKSKRQNEDRGGAGAPLTGRLSAKQRGVLEALRDAGRVEIGGVCERVGCTAAVISGLEKKGLVAVETVMEEVSPGEARAVVESPAFELTADQKGAINQIGTAVAARAFSVQVLFGVTGSGKTEVYVSAIRQALSEGRQAIMLVPEIALTTQTVRRLETRFERVAVLHSGMSDVARARTWAAIASGEIPVVIGTRSAVFAPCPALGVIIVDEEAEPSYKNLAAPRYHTRDVAIQRAHLEGIPVVLG